MNRVIIMNDIQKITNDISDLVNRLVRAELDKHIDRKYKEAFEWLVAEIENEHRYALNIVENFKLDNLTINSIEAEGYLRCTTTLKNIIGQIKGEN